MRTALLIFLAALSYPHCWKLVPVPGGFGSWALIPWVCQPVKLIRIP